jgi:hypothetical protein
LKKFTILESSLPFHALILAAPAEDWKIINHVMEDRREQENSCGFSAARLVPMSNKVPAPKATENALIIFKSALDSLKVNHALEEDGTMEKSFGKSAAHPVPKLNKK